LLFLKVFKKKKLPYKIMFGVVLFGGMNIFFSSFLNPVLNLILVSLLLIWRFKRPSVISHNLVIVLSLAGIGGSLGVGLSPLAVIVLLAALSVYDYIAVYKTKHMVKMAKTMIEQEVIFGLIVPDFLPNLKLHTREARPGEGFMFVGGGDVALPLLLVASVVPQSVWGASIIALFAMGGVFADHYYFTHQARPRPMPALPLIALWSVVGYLAFLLL
jgi:presenilin-like A22 family membrane protease